MNRTTHLFPVRGVAQNYWGVPRAGIGKELL
jgi:hypothetical protein